MHGRILLDAMGGGIGRPPFQWPAFGDDVRNRGQVIAAKGKDQSSQLVFFDR